APRTYFGKGYARLVMSDIAETQSTAGADIPG
ncbi:MAG: hypothetical protein HW373_219, partial [Deltaproteobacteria bacterium]|nr:hypothetical protein [Deltaproteobacteria bacterium]